METVAYRVATNIKHRSKGKTSKQTNKQVRKQIARIAKPIPIVIENRDSHYILNVCPCVCLSVHICDICTSLSFFFRGRLFFLGGENIFFNWQYWCSVPSGTEI